MKRLLNHPLWIHLPAIGLVVFTCLRVIQAWPLPSKVALHFGASGSPNRWGSSWEALVVGFGIMIGFIMLTVFLSELWARQETRKTFNWVALLDEAIVGFLSVMTIYWLDLIQQPQPVWSTPWSAIIAVVAGAVLVAAGLERLRLFRPFPHIVCAEDTVALEASVAGHMREGRPWAYLESQNPLYVSIISLGLPIGMTAGFLPILRDTSAWFAVLLIVFFVILGIVFYGGLRVQVACGQVVVRLGVLGLRLLRIRLDELTSVEVQPFNPLREFGGWGIRVGRPQWAADNGKRRGVWAFYFRGTKGVKLVRKDGRIYLIGSDHAERLCTVLRTAANLTIAET